MNRVLVSMLTYNGEKYLREQIDSILFQEGVKVTLFIRDDGSTDNTPSILQEYAEKYKEVVYVFLDKHMGLVSTRDRTKKEIDKVIDINSFEYFAYSDQDDVWLPDKLSVAINSLNKLNKDKPRLYLSNLRVTDSDLNERFNVYDNEKFAAGAEYALADARPSANTFVYDKKAYNLINKAKLHDDFYGDVWIYERLIFVGNVYYDSTPHILFRRTGMNASGAREKGWRLWLARIKRLPSQLKNNEAMSQKMALALLEEYSNDIDIENQKRIEMVAYYKANVFKRIRLLFSRKNRAKSLGKEICYRLRIIFGIL